MTVMEKAYKIRNLYNCWKEHEFKVQMLTKDIAAIEKRLEGKDDAKYYREDETYWRYKWWPNDILKQQLEQYRDLLQREQSHMTRIETETSEFMKQETEP